MNHLKFDPQWINPYYKNIWRGPTSSFPIEKIPSHIKKKDTNFLQQTNTFEKYYYICRFQNQFRIETLIGIVEKRRSNLNSEWKKYTAEYIAEVKSFDTFKELNQYLQDMDVTVDFGDEIIKEDVIL